LVVNPSGVDAALLGGVGYAVDGQHIGCDAVIDVVSAGVGDYVVKALGHDVVEAMVDLGFGPEVAHAVLNPFEVARCDAACVGEDVRDDEDAFVAENLVGNGGGGTVGALAKDFTADSLRILARDDVFGGGGNEDLAVAGEEFVFVDSLGFRKPGVR
jgi:hypothetical protein